MPEGRGERKQEREEREEGGRRGEREKRRERGERKQEREWQGSGEESKLEFFVRLRIHLGELSCVVMTKVQNERMICKVMVVTCKLIPNF